MIRRKLSGHLVSVCLSVAAFFVCNSLSASDENQKLYDYFFYEAVNQGQQANFAAAFDLLQYCLVLNPSSAAARFELAQYLMMLGDRVKSGKLLREAVALEPDNYWYWQLLGTYYANTHQYQEGIGVYEKMVTQFPSRTDILFDLMTLYENAGEYRKGIRILDRIELLEGKSLQGTVQRFQFYLEMNEVDSAYVVIKPNAEWAISTFADMVTNISELNSIRKLCHLAVADFPDNMTIHYWNAVSDYRAAETELALSDIDNGIDNISEMSDSVAVAKLFSLKGDICYNNGKMPDAFAAYERAMDYNPEDNMTANNYAYFLSLGKRDLKKAENLSLRTILSEPLNSTYLDTYAWILFAQKRYAEALEYIERAVKCQEEQSADIMEHCGDIYYMNGDVDGAVRCWHEAVELHSDSKTIDQKILEQKYIEENE